jgi:hypothetical protein
MLANVPAGLRGAAFLDQFLGITPAEFRKLRPLALTVAAKKARIMKHWGDKIGAGVTC